MNHRFASLIGLAILGVGIAERGHAASPGANGPNAAEARISVIEAGTDQQQLKPNGKSAVQKRSARPGLRVLDLNVRSIPPRVPRRENLCLNRARTGFPQPSSNSSEPGYGDCIWSPLDGVPWEGDYEWSSDYRKPVVPEFEVTFGKTATLAEIRVWLRRGYELKDFDVFWRDNLGSWKSIASVRGNRDELRVFTFPVIQTSAIKIVCASGPDIQPTIRRITELEAFGPRTAPPGRPDSFGYVIDIPKGPNGFVEVREAYGEGEAMSEVEYELRLDGRTIHRREHRCDGAGPITYAVALPSSDGGKGTLEFVDTSGQGLAIARVRTFSDPLGYAASRESLTPMVVAPRIEIQAPYTQPEPDRTLAAWVAATAPARSFVQPGLLAIVGYANPDSNAVAAKIRAYAQLAERHKVPWVLQLSSWWADTPLRISDGAGGHFGDIQYQQIGYSKFDTYDDPGLREFMDRESPGKYSRHYGLTVPNLWSDTPWLTMNNERLNAFKVKCVGRAIATVNEIRSTPGGVLLQAIVTDDEPIYWTRVTDWFEQGYGKVNGGVRRTDLTLDFNPSAVSAAARDGVTLDPADGLNAAERQWLNDNNSRYVALICSAIRDSLASPAGKLPDLRERIYNYLLAQPLYPLDDYGHPGWEIGMVPGAAIGLEASDERYFTRARDLGPLANSDFECANPTAETVKSWEPRFRAWHDAGCSFVQLCNPGPAERWQQLFSAIGNWNVPERRLERALSVMVQEAAIKEWRQASFR